MAEAPQEVTQLLQAWSVGGQGAPKKPAWKKPRRKLAKAWLLRELGGGAGG